MKKLLVLILVLGLATMVSAVPTTDLSLVSGMDYTVVGSTVTILSTGPVAGFAIGLMTPDAGTLTAVAVAEGFGIKSLGDPDLGGTGLMGIAGAVSGTPPVYVTGTLYTFTASGGDGTVITLDAEMILGLGDSFVKWSNDAVTDLNGSTITIPEPMTIALLGLGGLFLRRKK